MDISILHHSYKFYVALYKSNSHLPKRDRFALGSRSELLTLEIIELLIHSNKKRHQSRLMLLTKADTQLQILKLVVRLMKDVRAIDVKRYLELETKLQEIGKMLGGWIKSTELHY